MTTEQILLIVGAFCLGFFVESIFGLGGTIISLTILSFFFDLKFLAPITAFVGIFAAMSILWTGRQIFNFKIFGKVIIFLLPGTLIGASFLKGFSAEIILKIFGLFLIFYAIWTIFSSGKNFALPVVWRKITLFVGGIFGGIFGAPGPFVAVAERNMSGGKSAFRVLVAGILLFTSASRIGVFWHSGLLDWSFIFQLWWLPIPLFCAIYFGHFFHIKVSEKHFQLGVSVLLGLAGITFLL